MSKILILGASGMLGHTLFYLLSRETGHVVLGAVRSKAELAHLVPPRLFGSLLEGIDAYKIETIEAVMDAAKPDVLINCIGLIRQRQQGLLPLPCIEINARLPHLLHQLCARRGCRIIHYSTDCVFSSNQGQPHTEDEPPTAKDVYGLTKYLGELRDSPAITIRTSIIGPEIRNKFSLIEWFLRQKGDVAGYTNAVFSGLPSAEHARILAEFVLPNPGLSGLYHVAARPISKYSLLEFVSQEYGTGKVLTPFPDVIENKILCQDRFANATGYVAPAWPQLVREMRAAHRDYIKELT